MRPRRVAILGAESTGKSTLAEDLAQRYRTLWVPEYLREFVEREGRTPREEEQVDIAFTQVAREEHALPHARDVLFCDTTPLMTMLYSQHYWGRVDSRIAQLALGREYDLTLVTAPDTPWQPDGLQRESEQVRMHIHAQLLTTLAALELPFLLVQGTADERAAQVRKAL